MLRRAEHLCPDIAHARPDGMMPAALPGRYTLCPSSEHTPDQKQVNTKPSSRIAEKTALLRAGAGSSLPDRWVRKIEKMISTTIPPTYDHCRSGPPQ